MSATDPSDDGGATEHEQAAEKAETVGDGIPTAVSRRARNGTLALLSGGLLIGGAARAIRQSRIRGVVQGLAGAGLIVAGLRQRRTTGTPDHRYATEEPGPPATDVTISEQGKKDTRAGEGPSEGGVGGASAGEEEVGRGDDDEEVGRESTGEREDDEGAVDEGTSSEGASGEGASGEGPTDETSGERTDDAVSGGDRQDDDSGPNDEEPGAGDQESDDDR